MLHDFTIQNFRGFRDLVLPRLARVNLIVGKNNTGKSSLLEAIQIYASNGMPSILWEAVKTRDEHRQKSAGDALLSLFNEKGKIGESLRLGPAEDILAIAPEYIRVSILPDGAVQHSVMANPPGNNVAGLDVRLLIKSKTFDSTLPLLRDFDTYLRTLGGRQGSLAYPPHRLRSVFVTADGLSPEVQAELWDDAILSSLELEVVASLRMIVPQLDRLFLIGDKDEGGRSAFVRLNGAERPVPLKRLGDGVNRLFAMALALVNARDGILLIDEIENGIHYSVQEKLWRFILESARRLNVQVFATSHSWDCIEAFQRAVAGTAEGEGLVTRLEVRGDAVRASAFSEAELSIAVREEIEIR